MKITKDVPASARSEGQITRIVRLLKSEILDGQFTGERMNELRLAERYGVSRTPMRSALQALVGEGLVEYERNRGYRVRAYRTSEIMDAFELRAMAEGLAARLAAERGVSADEEHLIERALEEGDRALTLGSADDARLLYSTSNETFHSTVLQAARSRLVADVIAICNRVPQALSKNVMVFEPAEMFRRQRQHHEIYQAILLRRPMEAEAAMAGHVAGVRSQIARDLAARARRSD